MSEKTIINYLEKYGPATRPQIVTEIPLSRNTLYRCIRSLIKKGKIVEHYGSLYISDKAPKPTVQINPESVSNSPTLLSFWAIHKELREFNPNLLELNPVLRAFILDEYKDEILKFLSDTGQMRRIFDTLITLTIINTWAAYGNTVAKNYQLDELPTVTLEEIQKFLTELLPISNS